MVLNSVAEPLSLKKPNPEKKEEAPKEEDSEVANKAALPPTASSSET